MSNQERNRSKRNLRRADAQTIAAKRVALINTLARDSRLKRIQLETMTYAEIVAAKNSGRI